MIPVRVLLRNFLCYGELDGDVPIEFDFEGSRLWSISGDNGAGKSAIFDAITYSLFGQHRGGAQEDSRLIRKGARECEAIFEFRLDEHLFRARRTVGRPRGKARQEPKTWQAAWFDPDAVDWRPIPGTDSKTGLERWVREKLGFGYETFVASVLLLQGQSDQLIQAPPKKRFDILSGLLNLEPYKRLEAAAVERTKKARDEAQRLEGQLAGLPLVTAEEIEKAQEVVRDSDEALEHAQATTTQAELAVNEARRYAKLQTDLWEAKEQLKRVEGLLEDAERIHSEYEEWQRLSDAVPKLRAALEDLRQADRQATQAQEARAKAASIDLDGLKRAVADAETTEDEAEERARQLREERDALADALPLLRDVLRCRNELSQRERSLAEHGAPDAWEKQVTEREQVARRLQKEKGEGEAKQRTAADAVAQTKAALQQAEAQLTARREAKDEVVCSRCGQRISSEHIEKELEEAERQVAAAQRRVEKAQQVEAGASRELEALTRDDKRAQEELEDARRRLETSKRLEEERQRACTDLDRALTGAESAPAHLLAAVAKNPLADAQETVNGLDRRIRDLRTRVQGAEGEERRAREEHRQAQQGYEEALREIQGLEGEAQRLDEVSRGLRRQAQVRLSDVGAESRERAMAQDEPFIEALSTRLSTLGDVPEEHLALQKAADEQHRLETQIEALEKASSEVRPEHRLPVEDAESRQQEAQRRRREAQERRDEAREALRRLQEATKRRQEVEADSATANRQRALYARLADLLGRSGLQALLLDAAIQGIAHLANETLTRISGGQLQLQIRRQPSARGEEEIVIQAVDLASSDEPLDVQFVSGSQKFRASAALAAGIGQYAGRGAGSVRSLIIDEGFGSLDTQGRQEMIDELRNLSQLMDRIIVVSHQEDFQDRTLFPTGYILRKAGQQTEVERFV